MPKGYIFHSFFVIGKDNFAIFEKLKVMLAFAGRRRRRQRGGCVCGAASQRRMDVSEKGVLRRARSNRYHGRRMYLPYGTAVVLRQARRGHGECSGYKKEGLKPSDV